MLEAHWLARSRSQFYWPTTKTCRKIQKDLTNALSNIQSTCTAERRAPLYFLPGTWHVVDNIGHRRNKLEKKVKKILLLF